MIPPIIRPITILGIFTEIGRSTKRPSNSIKNLFKFIPHILSYTATWACATSNRKCIKMPSLPSPEPRNCFLMITMVFPKPTKISSNKTLPNSISRVRSGVKLGRLALSKSSSCKTSSVHLSLTSSSSTPARSPSREATQWCSSPPSSRSSVLSTRISSL
jgi:hypothetical protein